MTIPKMKKDFLNTDHQSGNLVISSELLGQLDSFQLLTARGRRFGAQSSMNQDILTAKGRKADSANEYRTEGRDARSKKKRNANPIEAKQ